jgi:hypothetical protein
VKQQLSALGARPPLTICYEPRTSAALARVGTGRQARQKSSPGPSLSAAQTLARMSRDGVEAPCAALYAWIDPRAYRPPQAAAAETCLTTTHPATTKEQ